MRRPAIGRWRWPAPGRVRSCSWGEVSIGEKAPSVGQRKPALVYRPDEQGPAGRPARDTGRPHNHAHGPPPAHQRPRLLAHAPPAGPGRTRPAELQDFGGAAAFRALGALPETLRPAWA